MRVLFTSSEIYPLAKTGGLADVSAALPLALAEIGIDVRLLMPGYPQALGAAANKSIAAELPKERARVIAARTPDSGLPIWLLDSPALFDRPGGLYCNENGHDWPDNAQRFALLSHAAVALARGELIPSWQADVVHANDWHTGLIPLLLANGPTQARPASLFTIHNLAYQGFSPSSQFSELGIPPESYDGVEFYGGLSLLKAGIRHADRITTVSPSYASEILTPEGGWGLDGLLRARARDLTGVLNGVDYRLWEPTRDPHLAASFSWTNLSGKDACKAALQYELGLNTAPDFPLIIYLSRVTEQKMADVVLEALPALMERDVQFALLGEGDPSLEASFTDAGQRWPGRIAIRVGYEEPLAHRYQAGADILLHPSRFEPCGLAQLYAFRYGTLPIVRNVGGLADTVVDADADSIRLGTASGFIFGESTAASMLAAVDRALSLYQQPGAWRNVQRHVMTLDFGWQKSAEQYAALYCELAPEAVGPSHRFELPDFWFDEAAG